MKLNELFSVSHSNNFVIYEDYTGDDQEPVCTTKDLNEIRLVSQKYGDREVAVIEPVEDAFYVWLDPVEEEQK